MRHCCAMKTIQIAMNNMLVAVPAVDPVTVAVDLVVPVTAVAEQ